MLSSETVMVLSAAVLNFCINGVWFVVRQRNDEKATEEEQKNPAPYLVSFIGSLWASYGLFLMIKHINPNSVAELISVAVGAWVCILMALSAKHYVINGRSLTDFVKTYIIDLIGLIVMCLVIYQI